jgi:hypothetical protein
VSVVHDGGRLGTIDLAPSQGANITLLVLEFTMAPPRKPDLPRRPDLPRKPDLPRRPDLPSAQNALDERVRQETENSLSSSSSQPAQPSCPQCSQLGYADLGKPHKHYEDFPQLVITGGAYRTGRSGTEYEDKVSWLLTKMRWTETGKAVIETLVNTAKSDGKRVLFAPYQPWEDFQRTGQDDPAVNKCTASAEPRAGQALVSFSPEVYTPGSACTIEHKNMHWHMPWTDEALVHECTHAIGHLTGHAGQRKEDRKWKGIIQAVNFRYDNLEEFFAITVANIYRSEKGTSGPLVFEHVLTEKPQEEVTGYEATSEGFLGQVWNLGTPEPFLRKANKFRILVLATLYQQEPDFFKRLAGVNAAFNPVRQYVTYRWLYDKEVGMA